MNIIKNKAIIVILTLALIGIYNCSLAQSMLNDESDYDKKGSFFSGGSLNIMFGTITFIEVSPHFGYYVTDRFSIAGGITGAYYSEKGNQYKYSTYIYGGRAFVRYDLFKQFFAQAEFEALNIENNSLLLPNVNRKWLYSPLMGIGYKQMISDLSGGYIMLLWNFDETLEYPYGNPILRLGIEFGWRK